MTTLLKLYKSIEQLFFFTLNRKLIGNIIFLFSFQVFMFLTLIYGFGQLDSLQLSSEAIADEQIQNLSTQILTMATVLLAVSFCATIGSFLFLRYLIVRPIRNLNTQLEGMNTGDIDLSNQLQAETFDEFSALAENYNRFIDQLRGTVHTLRKMGINVAVGSATVVRAW